MQEQPSNDDEGRILICKDSGRTNIIVCMKIAGLSPSGQYGNCSIVDGNTTEDQWCEFKRNNANEIHTVYVEGHPLRVVESWMP